MGLFQVIIEAHNNMYASLQGFRQFRCSPWVNKDFLNENSVSLIRTLESVNRDSQDLAVANRTEDMLVIQYQNRIIKELGKGSKHTGSFGLTTVTQMAAGLGLNKTTCMSRTATSALGMACFKGCPFTSRSPSTRLFLQGYAKAEYPDQCRRQQECALQVLNLDSLPDEQWTSDSLENANCEGGRADARRKCDPQLPGVMEWDVRFEVCPFI